MTVLSAGERVYKISFPAESQREAGKARSAAHIMASFV